MSKRLNNFVHNIKELLVDMLTLERVSVRFFGRSLFLRGCFKGIFPLPSFLADRPENIVPTEVTDYHAISKGCIQKAVIADLRLNGCSESLDLSSEFSEFIDSSFRNSDYTLDGSDGGHLYSFSDILKFEGAGKFVSVIRGDDKQLQGYLCAKDLLGVAIDYLGIVSYCSGRFTLISYEDASTDLLDDHVTGWHYDLDGHNFLKFFAYFDPGLGNNSGDHLILQGSHIKRRCLDFLLRRRLSINGERSKHVKRVKFDGNTGFFEDTACYHRASGGSGIRGLAAFHYIN